MIAALALREPTHPAETWTRRKILARYRHLRAITNRRHSEILDLLSANVLLGHARRLGLAVGRTVVLDDMDELVYAYDLAIHTAPPDRSRAIDRYARSARFAPSSDEALVLRAMRRAQFSIVQIERRHPTAGLVARDLFRKIPIWLMDEGLEISAADGMFIAMRLFTPASFSISADVLVPFDPQLLEDVLLEAPNLGRKRMSELLDDRRFAETLYRIALADGLLERIAYCDAGEAPDRGSKT
jgi:hypothetical protein